MVIQNRSILPRTRISVTEPSYNTSIHYYAKSLTLDPLDMSTLQTTWFMCFLFPLLLSFQILGISFLFHIFTPRIYTLSTQSIAVFYIATLLYTLFSSYVYMAFLNKESLTYLSFIYVTLLSMSYLPFSYLISILIPGFSFIPILIMAIITQYYLSQCHLTNYEFTSQKKRFIYSIINLALQYIYIFGIQSYLIGETLKRIA